MTDDQPVEQVLGIDLDLDDDELLAGGIVIFRSIEADGDERVGIRWTPGMSFVERRGMLEIAKDAQAACNVQGYGYDDDEDDEF